MTTRQLLQEASEYYALDTDEEIDLDTAIALYPGIDTAFNRQLRSSPRFFRHFESLVNYTADNCEDYADNCEDYAEGSAPETFGGFLLGSPANLALSSEGVLYIVDDLADTRLAAWDPQTSAWRIIIEP